MSSTEVKTIEEIASKEYKYGWVTDIEADSLPNGLNEEIIAQISAIKKEPEFMLEWRLKAYRQWLKMKEPHWSNVKYPPLTVARLQGAPHSSTRTGCLSCRRD